MQSSTKLSHLKVWFALARVAKYRGFALNIVFSRLAALLAVTVETVGQTNQPSTMTGSILLIDHADKLRPNVPLPLARIH